MREFQVGGVKFRFCPIPAGSFLMGSPECEPDRFVDEVQRTVEVAAFELAETVVTQALWAAVNGNKPSSFRGSEQLPVEAVSYYDVLKFVDRLNRFVPGLDARLPTEEEWEYSCRAGTVGARYGELDEIAWYHTNSKSFTHAVAQKKPNEFGICDMLGNVWEWTSTYDGLNRVLRGGAWGSHARYVRAACRYLTCSYYRFDNLGFRLARNST